MHREAAWVRIQVAATIRHWGGALFPGSALRFLTGINLLTAYKPDPDTRVRAARGKCLTQRSM